MELTEPQALILKQTYVIASFSKNLENFWFTSVVIRPTTTILLSETFPLLVPFIDERLNDLQM